MQHTAYQIHRHIQQAKKVMIVPHQNPDGDAIGFFNLAHFPINQAEVV
jgi:nanoRNase/pAp phosphatase (c-di-AMP/oligoRNAs hydrolase)